MRTAIFNALFDRMAQDKTIFFLWADMGLGLVERFEAAYPDRTLNVGIAEANMIGVAAGLHNAGYRPVTYTLSQFYLRAFEHVRLECGLNGAPLVMIGTSTGFDNAPLGGTHWVTDDVAALKCLPLTIFCPSTVSYAQTVLDRALALDGPSYVRIAKGSFDGPAEDYWYIRELWASETVIVTTGPLAHALHPKVTGHGLLALNKLHPLPDIASILDGYSRIIVVEDQVKEGLFASVCQLQPKGRVEFRGPDGFSLEVMASDQSAWRRYGMTAEQLMESL